MDTAWRSVLCQHGWVYPTINGNWVKFNEDGTGELHCGVGPASFICAELTWTPVDGSATDPLQPMGELENAQDACQHVSVDIDMTLRERRPTQGYETTRPDINVTNLTSAAFQPKRYTLQITKGAFPADKWLCFQDSPDSGENNGASEMDASYDFQIAFDRSPYPPAVEWAEQNNSVGRAIKLHNFWDFRDFYRDT